MDEENDWAVLDEIRITRFVDADGHESVSVDRKGDCSLITVLGLLDYSRDILLRLAADDLGA